MIDLLDILRIEETDISVEIFLAQLLSFQQQGISGLQDSLPGTHFQTLALTGNGHQHHIVLFLEARIRHALAYQVAVKCQVAGLQLPLAFHLGHTIDVMGGIHQLVRLAQVQDGINLAGIDQTVATKYEFIGGNGEIISLSKRTISTKRPPRTSIKPHSPTLCPTSGFVVGTINSTV